MEASEEAGLPVAIWDLEAFTMTGKWRIFKWDIYLSPKGWGTTESFRWTSNQPSNLLGWVKSGWAPLLKLRWLALFGSIEFCPKEMHLLQTNPELYKILDFFLHFLGSYITFKANASTIRIKEWHLKRIKGYVLNLKNKDKYEE